jgi:putative two-component system response regulator
MVIAAPQSDDRGYACGSADRKPSQEEHLSVPVTRRRLSDEPRIVVADDEPQVLNLVERVLTSGGYQVVAAGSGADALKALAAEPADLVLLDVCLGDLTGFDICKKLKADPKTQLVPVVLLTGRHDESFRLQSIEAGADEFFLKPFDLEMLRARVRALIRGKHLVDELESAESVLLGLGRAIEARDRGTDAHCQRLAHYATAVGRELNLNDDQLRALHRGAFLHDIGKVGIPDSVLLKPGPLTAVEFEIVKQHVIIGDRLCGGMRSLRAVQPIVRHHHERLDGSGYPDGLRGDEIPLLAQIMAVVDVFDAIASDRPYRPALPLDRAVAEIEGEVRRGWRKREIADALMRILLRGDIPSSTLPDPVPMTGIY